MTMKVRDLKEEDLESLERLARESYRAAFGHSMNEDDLAAYLEETRSLSQLRRAAQSDSFLVAEEGHHLCGYVQISDAAPLYENKGIEIEDKAQAIFALYVDPTRLGQGIGTRLLRAGLASVRLRNCPAIYLDVWAENKGARKLYERFGFVEHGRISLEVGGKMIGEDLLMRRAQGFSSPACSAHEVDQDYMWAKPGKDSKP